MTAVNRPLLDALISAVIWYVVLALSIPLVALIVYTAMRS